MKTTEWRHWTFSDVFSIINFNHALISSKIYSFIVIKTKNHIWKKANTESSQISRFLYVHLAHNISSHNYICSPVWRHEKIWNLLRFMIERRRRKESHHCHSLQKTSKYGISLGRPYDLATTVNTAFSLFVSIKCKFTITLIFLFLFVCKLFICFCKWHNIICFDTRFWLKQNNKGHESSSTILNVDSEHLLPFGRILPRTTISFIRTDLWLLLSKDDESCDGFMKKRLLK